MLFGNRETFALEIEPVAPSWGTKYLPESTAWAGFSVWLSGTNICRHLIHGTSQVQDCVYVPLASIADWFTSSWKALSFEEITRYAIKRRSSMEVSQISVQALMKDWESTPPPLGQPELEWEDQRYEWWERHFLLAGADGSHLPNLSFFRQEELLWIEAASIKHPGDQPPQFIDDSESAVVYWRDASKTIGDFVKYVGNQLSVAGLHHLFPWCTKDDPLAFASSDFLESISLFTGRIIDELLLVAGVKQESEIVDALGIVDAEDPAASAATQVLRDLTPTSTPDHATQVAQLLKLLINKTAGAPSGELTSMRKDLPDFSQMTVSPEQWGYEAAQQVRAMCKLGNSPIEDINSLCHHFGIRTERIQNTVVNDRMIAGVGNDSSAWIAVLNTPRTRVEHSYRFEITRGLGHLLLDSARCGTIGAASSSYAQEFRRRRSGAFAAELLIPAVVLASEPSLRSNSGPDLDDFRNVLSRFGVGKTTAAYQLWNHNLLPSRDSLDDLLELDTAVLS